MPQSSLQYEPEKILDQKVRLFQSIAEIPDSTDNDNRTRLIRRVLEHSLEDGMELVQSLGITSPEEILGLLDDIKIIDKHPKFFRQLYAELSDNLPLLHERYLAIGKTILAWNFINNPHQHKRRKERAIKIRDFDQSIANNHDIKKPVFTDLKAHQIFLELDQYYAGLLQHRKLRIKTDSIPAISELSDGEQIAETVMQEHYLALSNQIYTTDFLTCLWDLIYRYDQVNLENCAKELNLPLERKFQDNSPKNRWLILQRMYCSTYCHREAASPEFFIKNSSFLEYDMVESELIEPFIRNMRENHPQYVTLINENLEKAAKKYRYKPLNSVYRMSFKQAESRLKEEIFLVLEQDGYPKDNYEIVFIPGTGAYTIKEKKNISENNLSEDHLDPEFWELDKWKIQKLPSRLFTQTHSDEIITCHNGLLYGIAHENQCIFGPDFEIKVAVEDTLYQTGIKIIDSKPCFVVCERMPGKRNNKHRKYLAYYGKEKIHFETDNENQLVSFAILRGNIIPIWEKYSSDNSGRWICSYTMPNGQKNEFYQPLYCSAPIILNFGNEAYIARNDGKSGLYSLNSGLEVTGSFESITQFEYIKDKNDTADTRHGRFVILGVKDRISGVYDNDKLVSTPGKKVLEFKNRDGQLSWTETIDSTKQDKQNIDIVVNGKIIATTQSDGFQSGQNYGIINSKAVFDIEGTGIVSDSGQLLLQTNLPRFDIKKVFLGNNFITIIVREKLNGSSQCNAYTRRFGPKPSINELPQRVQQKLFMLFCLHLQDPYTIELYLDSKEKKEPSYIVRKFFDKIAIQEQPENFLEEMAAKTDPPGLATKVMHQLFPETVKTSPEPDRMAGTTLGRIKKGVYQNISHALQDTAKLVAGDPRTKNKKTVMTLREANNSFIATGAYTSFDPVTKNWRKSTLPTSPNIQEPCKVQTIILHGIDDEPKIVLPGGTNTEILPDRIRGITSENQEIPLESQLTPSGETVVFLRDQTADIKEIIYSFRQSLLPNIPSQITSREYEQFKRKFDESDREELSTPLFNLPPECKSFLAKITSHEPQQKLQEIETFVRQIGYYDFDDKEVDKTDINLEKRAAVMKSRLYEIREKKKNLRPKLAKKLFAGVCLDFSIVLTCMLREAGFLAGLMAGYKPDPYQKSVTTIDGHAISYVLWPTENTDQKIFYYTIETDGTPSGETEAEQKQLNSIQSPSLKEKIQETIKISDLLQQQESETLQALIQKLQELDPATLKKLENGKLETMLNKTARFAVKPMHIRHLHNLLNFWRYSGKMPAFYSDLLELDEVQTEMQQLLHDHYFREPSDQSKIPAEPQFKNNKDTGNSMMQLILDFIRRLEADPMVRDRTHAIHSLQAMIDLSRKFMEPIEYQAATLILTYLNTSRMQ